MATSLAGLSGTLRTGSLRISLSGASRRKRSLLRHDRACRRLKLNRTIPVDSSPHAHGPSRTRPRSNPRTASRGRGSGRWPCGAKKIFSRPRTPVSGLAELLREHVVRGLVVEDAARHPLQGRAEVAQDPSPDARLLHPARLLEARLRWRRTRHRRFAGQLPQVHRKAVGKMRGGMRDEDC